VAVSQTELEQEIARLQAELADRERRASADAEQLARYAAEQHRGLEREQTHARDLRRSYMATVRALSNAVEARDAYTGKHAERVAAYGLAIARAAGLELTDNPQIEFGFLLHDVGKVAVPDAILFKREGLSPEEFTLMSRHPAIGSEILRDIEFLGEAKQVVRSHHERWDGTGYPDGLTGEAIPLAARVFAVADTLDALTTDRPYRSARSLADARAEIRQAAGTQFDPAVVEASDRVSDAELERIRDQIS
jgi:ribonuclease P protein subunit RPR2